MTNWEIATIVYIASVFLTIIPVLSAFLKKEAPVDLLAEIEKNKQFTPEARARIIQHYERIKGTLGFWKNEAKKHKYFSTYTTFWLIPSTIVIPVLTQINKDNNATLMITLISTHSAILIAFSKALKTEANFRCYRMGESSFYDLFRRLLDAPQTLGNSQDEQLEAYFLRSEDIRKKARADEVVNNRPEITTAQ